jgi:hypothetical protein
MILTMIAATLWSANWIFGSRAARNGTIAWLDERAASGWRAGYSSVATRGFPNRIDTTINDLQLGFPDGGWTWATPFLEILRLSYKRDHVILVWANRQTVIAQGQSIDIATENARASVVFRSTDAGELDRANGVFDAVELNSDLGWRATIGKVLAAIRRADAPESYDVAIEATDVYLSGATRMRIDPVDTLPGTLQHLRIDATVGLDAPLDRATMTERHPAVRTVQVNQLQAEWGDIGLLANGDLSVTPGGALQGDLEVTFKNWPKALRFAGSAGWISESVVADLADLPTDGSEISVPLNIANGSVYLGPILLGKLAYPNPF